MSRNSPQNEDACKKRDITVLQFGGEQKTAADRRGSHGLRRLRAVAGSGQGVPARLALAWPNGP